MFRAPYRPPLVHTIYPCIGHNRWIIEYYWIVFCGIITKRFVISRIEWNITGMGMTRLGLRYIPDKLWRRENIDRWTKNVLRTSESDAFFPWWHLNISAVWEHLLLVRNGCRPVICWWLMIALFNPNPLPISTHFSLPGHHLFGSQGFPNISWMILGKCLSMS